MVFRDGLPAWKKAGYTIKSTKSLKRIDLPTIGPMFLKALIAQDMYLAGTILFFSAALLIVGNLVADIVLALVDPRIQHA